MFGHQDEPNDNQSTNMVEPADDSVLNSDNSTDANQPINNNIVGQPVDTQVKPDEDNENTEDATPTAATVQPDLALPSPSMQPEDNAVVPEQTIPEFNPSTPMGAPSLTNNSNGSDDLLAIKQSALQQLSPLVDHLEQTPEEKFHTTMMMIQASDDQSLIQTAFQAAKDIADDKTRAQALLDIVNEINYFTQHQSAQ